MSLWSRLRSWSRANLGRSRMESEMDAELKFHIAAYAEDLVRSGVPGREAMRRARLEFGGIERAKEECRDATGVTFLESIAQDTRYGLRTLRKSPGFTTVAVLTVALGIGANTAIFTILNSAALRLLPVSHADQLVTIGQNVRAANGSIHRNVHDDETFVSYAEYKTYARENSVFSGLLAYSSFTDTTLGGDKPRPILGTLASCNYFDVLQVRPLLGRFFTDSECSAPGESPVVVLGYAAWRETFAGDRHIVGETITLNRTLFRVIGVAPSEFAGTEVMASSFWAPLTMEKSFRPASDYLTDDDLSWLALIGRLRPGVSMRQAAANLSVVASGLNSLQPGRITTVTLGRATRLSAPSLRTPLLMIGGLVLGAVGLVLLLACANIANLLLARAARRRKEIAVRLTLGACRGRLIRQLLTESLVLALIGGVAGALGSFWSVGAIVRLVVAHLPISPEFSLSLNADSDFHTWFYALGLSILTACFFGLVPALRSSSADLTLAMKDDGAYSQTGTTSLGRLRNSLVGIQVAVCMLLLLASGLLLHGLYRAQTVDPGFRMKGVTAVVYNLATSGYRQPRAAAFQQQLGGRLASLPGVDEVVQATSIPLGNSHDGTGFSRPNGRNEYAVEYNNVSANFFQALGIPVLEGRTFTDAEERAGTHVVVLSQSTARGFFPAQNPIGQLLRGDDPVIGKFVQWRVVGVVADAQVADLGNSGKLYLYEPAGPLQQAGLNLMVHSGPDPDITKEIAAVCEDLDPNLPVTIGPLSETLEFWRAPARVASVLSVTLGALALMLASIGIYGMVSYSVSRRVREIGIRVALGADSRDVMWLVVRQAMCPVVMGALVGVVLCGLVSSIFSAILFGISPLDPSSFVLMPAFLLAVALLACYVPARRAIRIDPMVALRDE
jgi:predicted permease